MNFADIIVGAVIIALIGFAVVAFRGQKKKGGCYGSCSGCSGAASCTLKEKSYGQEKDNSPQ